MSAQQIRDGMLICGICAKSVREMCFDKFGILYFAGDMGRLAADALHIF